MTFRLEISVQKSRLRLLILIDEEAVWPHPGVNDEASDFEAEDIVSYLVDSWPSLLLTQTFPLQFRASQMPRSLTGLTRAAEARWDNWGEKDAFKAKCEQECLDAFLYRHDLSQMKFEAALEPFYVLRSGKFMRIETFSRIIEGVSFADFHKEMTMLGDTAAKALGDEHSLAIRWKQREIIAPEIALAFIAGLAYANVTNSAQDMAPLVGLFADKNLSEFANDNRQPILAAARGAGALGATSLCTVTNAIRKLKSGDGRFLADFRVKQVTPFLRTTPRPTDQGILVANKVRAWLHLNDGDVVDLDDLSKRLGIQVSSVQIPETRLDGLAVTAGDHGPSILLNKETRRRGAGSDDLERSLNFTWAHEIGHLLMDDPEEWPVLVDTLPDTQRLPRTVETRANAFATHLLLPVSTALQCWKESGEPRDWTVLEETLNNLTETYKLPRIAAARQLERGIPEDRANRIHEIFLQNIPGFEGATN